MWVIVLFDLPTDTKRARQQYSRFRKALLDDGFTMMQYSVYMRHSASEENAQVHVKRIKAKLPPDGEVRIVKITDKQFAKIQVFYGKRRKPTSTTQFSMSQFSCYSKQINALFARQCNQPRSIRKSYCCFQLNIRRVAARKLELSEG